MAANRTGGGRIKATERSFKIIEEIRRRDGAGVTELADHFECSKSTISEHLSTLNRRGYIREDDETYRIGLRFLQLGGHARSKEKLYHFGKKEIDEISAETGESAKIVVEEDGQGIYLYQSLGEHAVTTDSHLGTRVYLHATAVGKAIFAYLNEDRRSEIIDRHGLPEQTENTITDRGDLETRLQTIRDRGVAFDDEERIEGLRCVAAPIEKDDTILGALSISGPKRRIDEDTFRHDLPDLVKNTARIIEMNAKYSR
jgi:DNA-binding IclR family transcriptional regulator